MSDVEDKINQAIRGCIRDCFGSTAVLAKIAKYLDNLRQASTWHEAEIRQVEAGIRAMLKGMVVEQSSSPPRFADPQASMKPVSLKPGR
jgi:hypothetical protein